MYLLIFESYSNTLMVHNFPGHTSHVTSRCNWFWIEQISAGTIMVQRNECKLHAVVTGQCGVKTTFENFF